MNYLLDFILCSIVTFAELSGIIFISLFIQGLFYRIFKINIYQELVRILIKE